MRSEWNFVENVVLGFIPALILYLLFGGESFRWVLILGSIGGIIVNLSAMRKVYEEEYTIYLLFGEYVGLLKPGLFIMRLGGFGGEFIRLPKSTFTFEEKAVIDFADSSEIARALKERKISKLAQYHFPIKVVLTLQIDGNNIKNYFLNVGKRGFLSSPKKENGWIKHILGDAITSLTLIGLVKGWWYLKVHSDWTLERLEREVREAKKIFKDLGIHELSGGVEMLDKTIEHYGVKLVALNTEIDLPEDLRKANLQEAIIRAKKDAEITRAKVDAEKKVISARADARARKVRAKAEAEARAIKERRLAKEIELTISMLKEHGVVDSEAAADLAAAIHDVFGKEYFVKLATSGIRTKDLQEVVKKVASRFLEEKK